MELFVVGFLGMLGGVICTYFYHDLLRRKLRVEGELLARSFKAKEEEILKKAQEYKNSLQVKLKSEVAKVHVIEVRLKDRESEITRRLEEIRSKESEVEWSQAKIKSQFSELELSKKRVDETRMELDAKIVSYQDLQAENSILKRDLRNVDLEVRKTQLDMKSLRDIHAAIEAKVQEVGDTYLEDNVKWIGNSINQNNFGLMKQRLQKVIADCREMGLEISPQRESVLHAELKTLYEKAVRAAFEREEQLRIKAQIREERLREKEIEKELKQLEREREAIKVALEKALRDARNQHSEEVERLRLRLAEAEARSQRAISQAQLTKAGYVYVISNIGSFGDGVFKVGMTRRLEPLDRVRELGDASVPFPFDVHMMISSENAPALENALHKHLYKHQVNKINPRKEFFRTSIEELAAVVRENHGEIEYVADPQALQYRQSLEISEEDVEYIEHVYDELDEEEDESSTIPDGI